MSLLLHHMALLCLPYCELHELDGCHAALLQKGLAGAAILVPM
jgi:hypothetical protein